MKSIFYKMRKRLFRSSENNINYKTMEKMLKDNSEIVVIDVRTRDEYRYNHLKKAVNVPLQDICKEKVEQFVNNKSCIIIVYCEYGGRSKKAVSKLNKMGYENVYNLDGGIQGI